MRAVVHDVSFANMYVCIYVYVSMLILLCTCIYPPDL